MRRFIWHITLGASLVGVSALFYAVQVLIFHRTADTFFYMLQDFAFVPIQVLLVTLILNELLKQRERSLLQHKMNMVIGAFFSEVGNELIVRLASFDTQIDEMRSTARITSEFGPADFSRSRKLVSERRYQIDAAAGDLAGLRQFMTGQRAFVLSLLQNPNLLEHESFTELITHESVAEVISNPLAWRLPCISPEVARVDRVVKDGETWQWREFKMTAYHLPGQTLHHGGLLVEGRGMRLFFIGDSFIMSGIDDYCPPNRLFIGEDVGFDRCLKLARELKPDLLFNPHCKAGFSFTDEQLDHMLANWTERARLYSDLFPWDDPNFGMDESWVYCYPYEQRASPGSEVQIEVVITNHSRETREASAAAVFRELVPETNPSRATIPPKQVGRLPLTLTLPPDATPGRRVIPVNVTFGGLSLPQIAECIVVVD